MAVLLCTLIWFDTLATYTAAIDRPEVLLALLEWTRVGGVVACSRQPVEEVEEAVSTRALA